MRKIFLISFLFAQPLSAELSREQRDNQHLLSFLNKTINGIAISASQVRDQLENLEADINETVQRLDPALKRLLPNFQVTFATLKERIEKLRPFLSIHGGPYVNFMSFPKWLILSMFAIKPVTADISEDYAKIETQFPAANAPHNLIKNGGDWNIISMAKRVRYADGRVRTNRLWLSSEPLFPLDFVYQNYRDSIRVSQEFKNRYVQSNSVFSNINIEEIYADINSYGFEQSDQTALLYGLQPVVFRRQQKGEFPGYKRLASLWPNK